MVRSEEKLGVARRGEYRERMKKREQKASGDK